MHRLLALSLALLALTLPLMAQEIEPPTLTHGPMLGQPTATTMRVWGRTSMPGSDGKSPPITNTRRAPAPSRRRGPSGPLGWMTTTVRASTQRSSARYAGK